MCAQRVNPSYTCRDPALHLRYHIGQSIAPVFGQRQSDERPHGFGGSGHGRSSSAPFLQPAIPLGQIIQRVLSVRRAWVGQYENPGFANGVFLPTQIYDPGWVCAFTVSQEGPVRRQPVKTGNSRNILRDFFAQVRRLPTIVICAQTGCLRRRTFDQIGESNAIIKKFCLVSRSHRAASHVRRADRRPEPVAGIRKIMPHSHRKTRRVQSNQHDVQPRTQIVRQRDCSGRVLRLLHDPAILSSLEAFPPMIAAVCSQPTSALPM